MSSARNHDSASAGTLVEQHNVAKLGALYVRLGPGKTLVSTFAWVGTLRTRHLPGAGPATGRGAAARPGMPSSSGGARQTRPRTVSSSSSPRRTGADRSHALRGAASCGAGPATADRSRWRVGCRLGSGAALEALVLFEKPLGWTTPPWWAFWRLEVELVVRVRHDHPLRGSGDHEAAAARARPRQCRQPASALGEQLVTITAQQTCQVDQEQAHGARAFGQHHDTSRPYRARSARQRANRSRPLSVSQYRASSGSRSVSTSGARQG